MSATKHNVRFCFNHHNNDHESVYITQTAPDTYAFAGLWNNQGDTVVRKNYTMNGSEVRRWLHTTLRLMTIDDVPYASLQMDFPTMPIFVINQCHLRNNINHIMKALDFFLACPPVTDD